MNKDDEVIIAKPYACIEWARLLIRPTDYRIELYANADLHYTRRCTTRLEANQLAQGWVHKREINCND